jgi:hypothetical protein
MSHGIPPKSGGKPKSKEQPTYQTQPPPDESQEILDNELGIGTGKETNYSQEFLFVQDRFNKMKQLETQFVSFLTDDERIKYKDEIRYTKQPEGPEYVIEEGKIQEKAPEPVFALDLTKHPKRDEIGKCASEIEKYKQEFDEYVKKIDITHLPVDQFTELEVMRGDAGYLAKRIQPIFQSYQQINIGQVVQNQQNVAGDQVEKKEVNPNKVADSINITVNVPPQTPAHDVAQTGSVPAQAPLNYVAARGLTMDLIYKADEMFPSERFNDVRKEVVDLLKIKNPDDIKSLKENADSIANFLVDVYYEEKADEVLCENAMKFRDEELVKVYAALNLKPPFRRGVPGIQAPDEEASKDE